MTDFCFYHPTQPAWWQCPNCSRHLCPHCIALRKGGPSGQEHLYFCPRCNLSATRLKSENMIQPFWKRLALCFAYPWASVQSVGLILGLALMSTLFSAAGLFGVVFSFIPWALMVKYAYESLRSTSEGRFSPPPLSSHVLSENFGIVFKQILLIIALWMIFILFIARLPVFFWVMYGVVALISLPAMIIILAVNESVGQALNPVYFLGVAARIGWGYLLLVFFLSLLFSAPSALAYAIIRHLPEQAQLYFWTAAKNYYTLVSYHLMGYVILQYHGRLNHPVELDTLLASTFPGLFAGGDSAKTHGDQAELLGKIGRLVQEGDLQGAIALIQERTRLEIDDPQVSDRYLQLLKMCRRDQEYLDYIPRHLDLLVAAGDKSQSMGLYCEGFRKGGYFPASPAALFKVGTWFNEKGDAKTALAAFNHLTKIHPRDVLIPKAFFSAAQILHKKLSNPERAKKVLAGLISRYPNHEIAGFARTYMNRM